MAFAPTPDGAVRYEARVEPGARYALRVHQPPFSAVFALDTSGSIEPFREIVRAGLLSFAADVRPGREAVMLQPFDEKPLLSAWEDDPHVLQAAVNGFEIVLPDGSSEVESGLVQASELLREREGARAILLLTDGWTLSFDRTAEAWERLARVRPIIFSVHVIPLVRTLTSRNHMQDWAAGAGGLYVAPATLGEMDRAFERMATWLRRPAAYTLSYRTLDLRPSLLSIATPSAVDGEGGSSVGLAPGVGVEIILDTSGSMRQKLAGERRIDVAKASLRELVGETLAEGVPVAVRTFGGKAKKSRKARCQTRLSRELAPLDRRSMLELIDGLVAKKPTRTPIAAALAAVAGDLEGVTGARMVVLVTDGNETCGGDPTAEIERLREAGLGVTLNVIGFALADEELKATMAGWADAGDGAYFDATGAEELASSLAAALGAPFRLLDADGETLDGGTVGGGAIEVDPGVYRIEVLSDPPVTFEEVVVPAGQTITLELPPAES